MRMKDKVALISGAASGMGAATARLFAREGATVVSWPTFWTRKARRSSPRSRRRAARRRYLHLDVTDEAEWQSVVAEIEKTAGGLDVLVNNAGISGSAEQDLYDTAAWNRLMGINATGVFLGMKHGIAGHEEGRQRRLGDQPVVGLRHRRPGQHPCRLQRLEGRGAADHQGGAPPSTAGTASASTRCIPA